MTSYIYAFIDTRKGITFDQRIFYVGSTKGTPMLRLRQHLEDYFVNDPDREVFRYIRNTVGVNHWDMVILREDIPVSQQFAFELEYFHQLCSSGFKLRNSVKPHRSGKCCGVTEELRDDPLVSDAEIDAAYICQNIMSSLDQDVQAKINWAISSPRAANTLVDDLLHELKNELVRNRNLSTTTELVAKNRELLRSNGVLNRRDKERREEFERISQRSNEIEALYKEQIATLKQFKDHLLEPATPVADEVNTGEEDRGDDVDVTLMKGKAVVHPKIECSNCGKYISKINIAAHRKRCSMNSQHVNTSQEHLESRIIILKKLIPDWKELLAKLENDTHQYEGPLRRVCCGECGKLISKKNLATHKKRCNTETSSNERGANINLQTLVTKLESLQ